MKFQRLTMMLAAVSATAVLAGAPAMSQEEVLVGLITKTDNNPFFVKMQRRRGGEGRRSSASSSRAFAGKFDGDNDGQVAAVENLISAGAKGILITPSDTKAIVPTIQKARDAGILVIALDTPLEPIDAADATFATDNFKAGELIGAWAAKTLGDEATKTAVIAFLDALEHQPTVDAARDQGFMKGFGIDIKDPTRYLDEDDPRIVGHQWGQGAEEGGRTGMENAAPEGPGHQRRLHHQRADRGRRVRSAEGRSARTTARVLIDLGRRRLPGREERRGRRHRRHLDAVPAADGRARRRSGGGVREVGQEA